MTRIEKLKADQERAIKAKADADRRLKELAKAIDKERKVEEAKRRADNYKKLESIAELYSLSVEDLLDYVASDRQVNYYKSLRR